MNLKLTITKKKKVVTILRDKPPFVRQITETGMEAMNTNDTSSNIFDVPWVVMNGLPYQKTAPVHSFNSRSSKKKINISYNQKIPCSFKQSPLQ